MRPVLAPIALAVALMAAVPAAPAAPREAFPLSEIVLRSQRGETGASLVRTLRTARTSYALRGSDFARLRAAGVADDVLDQLQQSFTDDVDFLVRYWYSGSSQGRCGPCYPQQVDLSGLPDGAAVRQSPPPLTSNPGRPLGLPDWYRTTRGHAVSGGISVEGLRAMAAKGASQEEMLQALRTRAVIDVIGIGGKGSFGSHLVAGISGSTFADLHAAGISDAVLDELQANYLAVYVEYLRLRHLTKGKGSRS